MVASSQVPDKKHDAGKNKHADEDRYDLEATGIQICAQNEHDGQVDGRLLQGVLEGALSQANQLLCMSWGCMDAGGVHVVIANISNKLCILEKGVEKDSLFHTITPHIYIASSPEKCTPVEVRQLQ